MERCVKHLGCFENWDGKGKPVTNRREGLGLDIMRREEVFDNGERVIMWLGVLFDLRQYNN